MSPVIVEPSGMSVLAITTGTVTGAADGPLLFPGPPPLNMTAMRTKATTARNNPTRRTRRFELRFKVFLPSRVTGGTTLASCSERAIHQMT